MGPRTGSGTLTLSVDAVSLPGTPYLPSPVPTEPTLESSVPSCPPPEFTLGNLALNLAPSPPSLDHKFSVSFRNLP